MGSSVPLNVSHAIQELVRTQVDRLLSETHQRAWNDWHREDLRQSSLVSRKECLWSLLDRYSGLLSGFGAASLADDSFWLPMYILRADVPRTRLAETPHSSDFRICNVVWEHISSGALAVTLFNNHMDPSLGLQDCVSANPHTGRSPRGVPQAGRKTAKFLRATGMLMDELGQVNPDGVSPCVAFRVGHFVCEYTWSHGEDGERCVSLKQLDLMPKSLQSSHRQPDTIGSRANDTHSLSHEHEKNVSVIYRERFRLRLSEKTVIDAKVTEPSHERSLVEADEVLVTVIGLDPSCTPECLFGGVWGMLPPREQWTIPSRVRHLPAITFYKPSEAEPSVYCRGYRVPCGLPLNRLGINYSGDLARSVDGRSILTAGILFEAYLRHLCAALDDAFRSIPDLAIELALDILTEQRALPHSFGTVLAPSPDIDEEGTMGYRRAFEAAWRMLDSSLPVTDTSLPLYPYTTQSSTEEIELVRALGYHPILVQVHVRQLLKASKAYLAIKVHAEQRLLSAPGAEEPPGTDRLVAALTMLFPNLEGDIVSVRRYENSYPVVLWDGETRTFVMSSSAACPGHGTHDLTAACFCWVGTALFAALASWRSKAASDGDGTQGTASDTAAFHALLRCAGGLAENTAILRQSTSSHSSYSSRYGIVEQDVARSLEQDGDEELEYIDPVAPTSAPSAVPHHPLSSIHAAPPEVSHEERSEPRLRDPFRTKPPLQSPRVHSCRPRRRSEVFVITPLLPSARNSDWGEESQGHRFPEKDAAAPDASPRSASAVLHAPSSWNSNAGARDIADMSDILHDAQDRVDARVQAMVAYYSRDASGLQDQLARAQRRVVELEASLENARQEHVAALAAFRAEHADVLAAKEEALQARERALESKDDMLCERDGSMARLREGLRAQTRRAVGLQGEVRRLRERERRQSERLQMEMESLMARLSQIAQRGGEQSAAGVDEVGVPAGEGEAQDGRGGIYGDGERTLKRKRTH
ncbi:hypothetical protein ACG7TL_007632 [Trametes sanguinea]